MNFVAPYIGSGIFLYASCIFLLLFYLLKRLGAIISIGDPISVYVLFRLSSMFVILYLALRSLDQINTNLLILYVTNLAFSIIPIAMIRYRQFKCEQTDLVYIYQFATFIVFVKVLCVIPTLSSLPIFTGGGSDEIINYYDNNKLISVFLLGIGSIDLIILSFLRRSNELASKRMIINFVMFFLIFLVIASMKKGAMINMIFSILFGEALAYRYLKNVRRQIINFYRLVFLVSIAILWAFYVAQQSGVVFGSFNIIYLLDFGIYQFMVPYLTYFTDSFWTFSESYNFSKGLFYFHTVTSPLGYPAFDASIGTSYHEFLTGNMSGNGINPTFLLDGIIFWGKYGLLTTFLYLIVGIAMVLILRSRIKASFGIILTVILISLFPVLWIDSLLFMKRLLALFIIFIAFICYKNLKKILP